MSGDYTRINKSSNFDDLRTHFQQEGQDEAKQIRLKHDFKRDGKVKIAGKSGSEGEHKILSGRKGKFKSAESFILKAFERSTGTKSSNRIKNMIKADQTALPNGKTIRQMLNDVREQWHIEVKIDFTLGKGMQQAFDAHTKDFSTAQKNAMKSMEARYLPEIERAISEKISQAGDRTVSQDEIKSEVDGILQKYAKMVAKAPDQGADVVSEHMSKLLKATTAEEAGTHAKALFTQMAKLPKKQQIGGIQLLDLTATIYSGIASKKSGDVPKALADVGKFLTKREVDESTSLSTLMRKNNPASTFNKAFLVQFASEYSAGVKSSFLEKFTSTVAVPGHFTHGEPPKKEYDTAKVLDFPKNYGLTKDSTQYLQLQTQRNTALEQGAKMLLNEIQTSYDKMPTEVKNYLATLGTVSDDKAIKSFILNDALSLRFVMPDIAKDLGSNRRGNNPDGTKWEPKEGEFGHDLKRMQFEIAFSSQRVAQSITNFLDKNEGDEFSNKPDLELTKQILFEEGTKENLSNFYTQIIEGGE